VGSNRFTLLGGDSTGHWTDYMLPVVLCLLCLLFVGVGVSLVL
jgi:hypothetical protein